MDSIQKFKELDAQIEKEVSEDPEKRKFVEKLAEWDRLFDKSKALIKSRGKGNGQFKLIEKHKITYDTGILKDLISEEMFKQVTDTKVNKKAIDLAIERGDIDGKRVLVAQSEKLEYAVEGPKSIIKRIGQ
jgi:hypothetical protein